MTNLTAFQITNFTKTNGFINMIYTLFYNYNVADDTFVNSEEFNYVISEEKIVLSNIFDSDANIISAITVKQGNQTVFRATTDMYDIDGQTNLGVYYTIWLNTITA